MASFDQVRRRLAAALENVADIRAVYSAVPDSVSVVPCAIVVPGEPAALYHRTSAGRHAGTAQFNFDVVVVAARFGNSHGQTEIDRFMGTDDETVVRHIEADQTLSDTALTTKVTEAGDYGQIRIGDTDFVGCRFIVEVHA